MHRTLLLATLIAVVVSSLAACDNGIKTSDFDIKVLSSSELHNTLEDPKSAPVVLVDPRTPARYQKAHVDGAVNIFLPEIKPGHPALANAKTIVVVAGGWTDAMGPAATKRLMSQGYQNVYDYRGGLQLWESEGGKVIRAATQPAEDSKNETK